MRCLKFYKTFGFDTQESLTKNQRIKFNKFVFENYFKPRMEECKDKKTVVELSEKDIKFIENFSKKKISAKIKEWGEVDNKFRMKRELTGASIEYGLLKFFGKEKEFDDSVVDESHKRNYPDLLPLGVVCDVKGSSINHTPLVFNSKRTYVCHVGKYKGIRYRCSNIIGITDHKFVWLLGIASPIVLKEYTDDNLIIMAKNSSKTGFYGANKLENIPIDWDEFKKTCSDKSLFLS